jgi:hypothetical protein
MAKQPSKAELKGVKADAYTIRITEEMLRRGYRSRKDMAWECVDVSDGWADCQLCGHSPIRYLFTIRNNVDGKTMVVGSECVNNVQGINPDSAEQALRLFKKAYNEEQKKRRNEQKEARKAEYAEKYAKEIAWLRARVDAGVFLARELFDTMVNLESGKKVVKPAEIKAVQLAMAEAPVLRSKQQVLEDACGGKEALVEFTSYVLEKHTHQPSNDFWASIWTGLDSRQYLSDRQIAAVKKCMNDDRTMQTPKNMAPIRANVEVELKGWLAREHEISKFLQGDILQETAKGVYFKGHCSVRASSFCLRCGRELTHPVSLVIGYGPECCEKLHIPWVVDDPEAIEKVKKQLVEKTWEGWLPKSKISIQESAAV